MLNKIQANGCDITLFRQKFNCLEFEAIEKEAGLNSFVLTSKRWIEQTNAIGIQTKQGRYAAFQRL